MNLLNYKKIIKNKYCIILLTTIALTSCIEEKDYRTPENFNKLMNRTIKFADDFNDTSTVGKNRLLGFSFKINKEKKIKKKGDSYLYYRLSVPYNLRGKQLNLFLEEFTDKHMKKNSHLIIELEHMYAEYFSGTIVRYDVRLKERSSKLTTKLTNYISKKNLQKKGIKHYMLEYDFQILAQISQEIKNNKNLSVNSAIIRVSRHYKTRVERIQQIIKFARKYYKKI